MELKIDFEETEQCRIQFFICCMYIFCNISLSFTILDLCDEMSYEKSIMRPTLFSAMVKFMQPVFVTRSSANSRAETINEIKKRAYSNFGEGSEQTPSTEAAWQQMAIFPEGTTTNRQALITFKTGAFQPGVPVQPVVVRWSNHFDTVTWAFVGPSL